MVDNVFLKHYNPPVGDASMTMNIHSNDNKKRSLHRIKIIQGHLKAVEKMIENDDYCVDIIHQSRAIQTALKKLDMFILETHLKTCVVHQIHDNQEERTVKELLTLYDYKE